MKSTCCQIATLCLLSVAGLTSTPVLAQKTGAQGGGEMLMQAQPKDILTRAKLHTELASLYFQSGNLIVALEEATIAIAINPDYAQAYALRGVVLFHIKEFASADKDFQKALSLDEKDPEMRARCSGDSAWAKNISWPWIRARPVPVAFCLTGGVSRCGSCKGNSGRFIPGRGG